MIYLADVNVWTALAIIGHTHHAIAAGWFQGSEGDEVVFCRVTQHSLLRLLTNRHVMGENVLSPSRAWEVYDRLRRETKAGFVQEPVELERFWRDAAQGSTGGPNFWTDAYLAAFAAAAGLTVKLVEVPVSELWVAVSVVDWAS